MQILYQTSDRNTFGFSNGKLMTFDASLQFITDRTQQDVDYIQQLASKLIAGTATNFEKAEWNSILLKGAYNYNDLNRVTAIMEDLKLRLERYGYAVPGYQRIEVPHPVTGGGSKLPEGYTELAWIESTGTQYIDTEFYATSNNIRVVCDWQYTQEPSDDSIFGSQTSGYSVVPYAYSSTILAYYVGKTSALNRSTIAANTRYLLDLTANAGTLTTTLNGSTATATYTQPFESAYSIYVFANNNSGSAIQKTNAKLYGMQIYSNGILVCDYVPCINPDGEVGLYDLVTTAFFGNSGTGAFIAGDVVSLPSGVVSMTNLVADGSFETTGTWTTWSADALVTEQSLFGSKSLKLTGDQLANVSVETPIVGHKYYGREYIKTDGEVTIGDGRFEVHGGDGVGLNWVYGWNRGNYPNWIMQSAIHEIEVVNASSYVLRTFKVGGTGTAYVDGILLVDLTAAFGAGFEPDKEWCDKYIPFFEGTQLVELPPRYEWKEYDAPTPDQMTVYLRNVSSIRSVLAVLASTPNVPDDMVGLMVQEANNIEAILLNVYRQLTIMPTTFIPCGEALCGGDNL